MFSGLSPSGRRVNLATNEIGQLRLDQSMSMAQVPVIAQSETLTITDPTQEQAFTGVFVKIIEFFCRSNVTIRYAFEPGLVVTRKDPYRTLPSGASQAISFPGNCVWSGTIYFASDTTSTIEIETWSEVH